MKLAKGKKVVIRNEKGEDEDVGTVQDLITEGDEQYARVRTQNGDRVVPEDQLVEHLED